ncbi:adenosylcobinamide-phosphate synthase CbiB [Acidovorax sp. SUPP3334]|uniref:adenosylcobinamide-phosphate synthase CbiB n=1 Tax=Acidovorax sp. SUPP3334 TaxID=2920881 RepID=UPI0024E14721|nr:adenosylcobinamide-phosphate synthase CbiB [Acidovorax sp. SUPP3334]
MAAWPMALAPAAAVPLALAIDRCWGEPPVAVHPVVWMGRALQACGDRAAPLQPTGRDLKSFWLAALLWCAVAAIVLIVACAAQVLVLRYAPPWLAAVLMALLLKPLLAWRMLRDEVLAVESALAQSLQAGRARLARLVSRDVSGLDACEVRESAIESLAENLNDSVVAPLFWFALLGLPGAALYRFANTADAMWGYPGMRGGRYWQWAGKWAARADDVLSWLPARITACLLWAIAGRPRWRTLVAEAHRTPSPNSGWPMAAMALSLGVHLAKPGVYTLNAPGRNPGAHDTPRAARWASNVVIAAGFIALIAHFSIAIWWLRWM